MKKFSNPLLTRNLSILLLLLFAPVLSAAGQTDDISSDFDVTEEERVVPSFVQELVEDASWWTDIVCVVDGKAYYFAFEDYGRMGVLYNEDRILAADPTLQICSCESDSGNKFVVSVVGKSVPVDFSDKKSIDGLSALSAKDLPSYTRFSHDYHADFGKTVLYSFTADFPSSSVVNSKSIRKWLVGLVEESLYANEVCPEQNTHAIGYSKKVNGRWIFDGNANSDHQIPEFASNLYFASIKEYFGSIDEEYPAALFTDLNLEVIESNNRYVTYQMYTHGYYGGAHGMYTERLVSFDHVNQQAIDNDYLFKPECMDEVLAILIEEAEKTQEYKNWNPNIMECVTNVDDAGNPTGGFTLPDPGLTDEGIVFSFQPYDISCFAAGAFHFTIPYQRIENCLTDKAKCCIYNLEAEMAMN